MLVFNDCIIDWINNIESNKMEYIGIIFFHLVESFIISMWKTIICYCLSVEN